MSGSSAERRTCPTMPRTARWRAAQEQGGTDLGGRFPEESRVLTYQDVLRETCKYANVREKAAQEGRRVTLYMPIVPEAGHRQAPPARASRHHRVVFGGFSPSRSRTGYRLQVRDSSSTGGRGLPAPQAAWSTSSRRPMRDRTSRSVKRVIVLSATGKDIVERTDETQLVARRVKTASAECPAEPMAAEALSSSSTTSGSTGSRRRRTPRRVPVYNLAHPRADLRPREEDTTGCTAMRLGHGHKLHGLRTARERATRSCSRAVPNHPDWRTLLGTSVDKYGGRISTPRHRHPRHRARGATSR